MAYISTYVFGLLKVQIGHILGKTKKQKQNSAIITLNLYLAVWKDSECF